MTMIVNTQEGQPLTSEADLSSGLASSNRISLSRVLWVARMVSGYTERLKNLGQE